MPSSPSPSESQLTAFRQKAGPILAEARGLTPGALAKLGDIARDLGLADDQVQEAMLALHGGVARPKDPAVEKFRKRLRKDLAAKKTIVGPEIEARIVAGGVQKYQLSEQAILEVLAEVTSELGLRRITGNEALAHFVEMVDAAIGERTWLNRQSWDRLRMASEKWGLTFEDADALVEQKLDANRRDSFRGKLFGWVATYGSIGVVACVLVTIAILMSRAKNEPETSDPESPTGTSPGGEEIKPAAAQGPPDWWGYELAIAATEARREVPGFSSVYKLLVSDQPAQRGEGYTQLVNLGARLAPSSSPRTEIEEIIVSCHAREPDESATQELRTALMSLIPQHATPLSADTTLYERAFWGVGVSRLVLKAAVVTPNRPATMASALSSALGVAVKPDDDDGELAAKTEAALSALLFQHLVSAAPRHPESAPVLHQYLLEHGRLPSAPEEREPLEAAYLAALLPASEANWRDHQDLLTSLVRSKNPLVTLRMVDLMVKASDRGLQSLLAEELVRHTGAKPRTSDLKDVARSVRQALGAAGVSSAQSQEDRWDVLRLEVGPSLGARPPAAANHAELLKETVELARLATLAAALSQGEAGIPVFDELLVPKTPTEPAEKDAFADGTAPAAVRPRSLSRDTKQKVEQMIATLRAFHQHQPIARTGSLRALAQIAPQVPDLTYEQATAMSRYLFAEKADPEQQAILGLIPHFKAWKQLRLALADHVEESKLPAGQVQELVNGLLGDSGDSASQSPRRALVLSVQHDLGSGKGNGKDASSVQAAAEQLAESYRTRARMAGVSSAELTTAESPGQVLELLVQVMAKTGGEKKATAGGEAGIAEQLEAARFLGTSDLRKTVLLQRLVIRAAVERITTLRPRQAEAAALVLSSLETADASAENLLIQLYHGEAATLKLGMLYGAN
ncbi:MAG: hypothetical protein ACR2FY_04615 [Pirellulaceae bacterium]